MALQSVYTDLDLNKQKLTNYLANPLTTTQRAALTLAVVDTGYACYDTTELRRYIWTGTGWAGELKNPMTSTGDLIVGGVAGAAQRVAPGISGYVLTSAGTSISWQKLPDRNVITTLTFAANQTWNVATTDNAIVTLTANMTGLTITGAVAGRRYTLTIVQDAVGLKTAMFGSLFKWVGGVLPVLSTTPASRDIVVFYYDGVNYNSTLTKAFS